MQVNHGDQMTLQLVEKVKTGNEKAAEMLYHQYAKAMYNTLIRMTNQTSEAEDLLQEAFVKAFRNIHQYQGHSTFGSWLKRVVVNTGLESLRKKSLPIEYVDEEYLNLQIPENDLNWSEITEDVSLIRDAIKDLPRGSRNIVTLYLLEGYTHDEIGEIMNISPSTSKTQYMRGKALLKKKILDRYERRKI
jgi:RNA polymerase sigma factor (sigma-70 family)